MGINKKKVVLFLPPMSETQSSLCQKLPIEILSLAGLLLRKGYHIIPIDAAIREKYINEIIEASEGALCLGISCIHGYQVYAATAVAKLIKEKFPELPIVFGGWFPSVRPDLFLNNGLADVVVRGQGEETFTELVESFREGGFNGSIEGISYKKEGQVINNRSRRLVNLDDLPPIPYHLIADDLELYIESDQNCEPFRHILMASTGVPDMNRKLRMLWYYSSYGCPNNCNFCCSPEVTGRRWVAKDPIKAADEVEELVKRYLYNLLFLVDANFCVNENRVKKFCKEMIKRSIDIKWYVTGDAHSISHYKEETLDLMAESGCFCVFLGAESACAETLHKIDKNIEVGEIEKSVSALIRRKIIPEVSYVVGFPDESSQSIDQTINEWLDLKFKNPIIETNIRLFHPLPGSGFYQRALQLGYKDPKFPEGYREFSENATFFQLHITGWIRRAQIKKLRRYQLIYFKWAYDILTEKLRLNLFQKILNRSALFRIKHRISVVPIEFWLYRFAAKIVHKLNLVRRELNKNEKQ